MNFGLWLRAAGGAATPLLWMAVAANIVALIAFGLALRKKPARFIAVTVSVSLAVTVFLMGFGVRSYRDAIAHFDAENRHHGPADDVAARREVRVQQASAFLQIAGTGALLPVILGLLSIAMARPVQRPGEPKSVPSTLPPPARS